MGIFIVCAALGNRTLTKCLEGTYSTTKLAPLNWYCIIISFFYKKCYYGFSIRESIMTFDHPTLAHLGEVTIPQDISLVEMLKTPLLADVADQFRELSITPSCSDFGTFNFYIATFPERDNQLEAIRKGVSKSPGSLVHLLFAWQTFHEDFKEVRLTTIGPNFGRSSIDIVSPFIRSWEVIQKPRRVTLEMLPCGYDKIYRHLQYLFVDRVP